MSERAAAAWPLLPDAASGPHTLPATVTALKHQIDVNTLEQLAGQDAGAERDRRLQSRRPRTPIAFDPYAENRDTGAFILIDRYHQRDGWRPA